MVYTFKVGIYPKPAIHFFKGARVNTETEICLVVGGDKLLISGITPRKLFVTACSKLHYLHGPFPRHAKLRVAHAPGTFSRHRLQRKLLVNDLHHSKYVTHEPWCMSGSLTLGGGEKVPGIPGACASRNFPYLIRGSCGHRSVVAFDHTSCF